MDWIADPETPGGWLHERLDEGFSTMHGVVPHGYAAYARVFHPTTVRSLPGRAVPSNAELSRLPEAERRALLDAFVDEPTTWRDAADAFGTTMHPLAQWRRLVRIPPEDDWNPGERLAADGREFQMPDEGTMPVADFAAVAAHLTAHTTTPDAGFVGVWEGWGGLVGFYGETPSRAFLEFSDDPHHQELLNRSIHDPFNNDFRKRVWQPGILPDAVSNGERLRLPGRDHILFSSAPRVFADPDWILDAPWRDRVAEEHGFPPDAQHPSILWPADRAWVMVSEIDLDSTVVAGSAELVRALCDDDRLEALPIPEGADLSWAGDTVNG